MLDKTTDGRLTGMEDLCRGQQQVIWRVKSVEGCMSDPSFTHFTWRQNHTPFFTSTSLHFFLQKNTQEFKIQDYFSIFNMQE